MPKFNPAIIPTGTPTMPQQSDRGGYFDHVPAADLRSSDVPSSWVISPSKRQKEKDTASPTPRKDGVRRADAANSLSRSARPPVKEPSTNFPDNASISSASTVGVRTTHPTTPSKGSAAGTPSSRNTAIDKVFKKMAVDSGSLPSTPSRPGHEHHTSQQRAGDRRVIIIEDSDDEAPTDLDVSDPPTRSSSLYDRPIPISTDSSQSSMNSLFSKLSVTSSVSSMESFSMSTSLGTSGGSKTQSIDHQSPSYTRKNAAPAYVRDIFNTELSPNVTQRKIQKVEAKFQSSTTSPSAAVDVNKVPESVLRFSNSPFGTDLERVIIAHCDKTQKMLDENEIEWGTQYELARGVSTGTWSWDDVRAHGLEFKGSNEETAPKVQSVMGGRSAQLSNLNIWKELDREQAAIKENMSRGLGLMGSWKGSADWYGGQVQQLARLVKSDTSYKIVLEPMEKRRSHRFARYYGSRRFVQLRIPDELLRSENERVKAFLRKSFVLCGRIFLPFHSKDGHLYMVETDENWGRTSQPWCGDQFRKPFHEFINWHNPLDQRKNCDQVISKYVTRFALGLSNSVPALEFEEENIIFIDDITSSEWPQGKKNPPAKVLMTDGCGFMNHAALHSIVKLLGYENIPAGVQGRIDGSKGFWILHPTDQSSVPKIWIRTSQNKIKNRFFDRAHRIFDLLCPSRPSPTIALSQQSITNLFSNGVPEHTLVRLMEEGLEEEIAPLLEWSKPYAMVFLWDAINKTGNVSGARTQRLAASLNRALGLKGRDWGHESVAMDNDPKGQAAEDAAVSATYTGRNKYSAAPLSLDESALELVQAGFHPAENKLLYDKLKRIIELTIDSSVKKYRIPIEESLGAFVVPDPLGVLKEGEIYYRFSRPRKDPRTEMLLHILEGEIVLGRYPIRLPSDMQKVRAVDRRELDRWPDVIIISTQGKRSIASLLADGDMDGDELIATWDPAIVEAFDNKGFTNPPDDLMTDNFDRDVETVEKFSERTADMSQRETSQAFQEVLIANLSESNVGLYSMMHENAIVKYGYGHVHSIRLAYIFGTLLDANKTGHRLKPGMLELHLKMFGNRSPQTGSHSCSSKDILEILTVAGQKKGQELLERYEKKELKHRDADIDLRRPYDAAMDYALQAWKLKMPAFNDEMQRIRKHVEVAKELFGVACAASRSSSESPSKSRARRKQWVPKADQEDLMLACARAYAKPLDNIILTRDIERVKASYAYVLSRDRGSDRESFAFAVAFQELCHIKAMASGGGHAPSLRIFDEGKSFSSSFLRALKLCEDGSVV
ncbi:RNA dependent RNA polymerase-domain-containing protein [Flammula alnicola]|nr:RNA dependent RNA polymerase-domain-containing protein [Flammula alnicola]